MWEGTGVFVMALLSSWLINCFVWFYYSVFQTQEVDLTREIYIYI